MVLRLHLLVVSGVVEVYKLYILSNEAIWLEVLFASLLRFNPNGSRTDRAMYVSDFNAFKWSMYLCFSAISFDNYQWWKRSFVRLYKSSGLRDNSKCATLIWVTTRSLRPALLKKRETRKNGILSCPSQRARLLILLNLQNSYNP